MNELLTPRTTLAELREKLSGMDDISGVVPDKSVVFDDDGYCQSHPSSPPKGYWRTDGETYTCTFCGFKLDELWDYCPACVDE